MTPHDMLLYPEMTALLRQRSVLFQWMVTNTDSQLDSVLRVRDFRTLSANKNVFIKLLPLGLRDLRKEGGRKIEEPEGMALRK